MAIGLWRPERESCGELAQNMRFFRDRHFLAPIGEGSWGRVDGGAILIISNGPPVEGEAGTAADWRPTKRLRETRIEQVGLARLPLNREVWTLCAANPDE